MTGGLEAGHPVPGLIGVGGGVLAAAEQISPLTVFLGLLLLAVLAVLLLMYRTLQRNENQTEQMMRELSSRRNELEATLSSMIEGVLAVDLQGRLLSINDAATRLLNVRVDRAIGRSIQEVVENPELRQFIQEMVLSQEPLQSEVDFPPSVSMMESGDHGRQVFRLQGAVLHDIGGRRIGSLIVLHDVTQLHRLEVVRSDFVANASHEIKTPVTAIKAAAETLLSTNGENPDASRRFLEVIARQADRLGALIEDLLCLARLEQTGGDRDIELKTEKICPALRAAAETCSAAATGRQIDVRVECSDRLTARVHAPLFEQALVNLIDNAIKYSSPGSPVQVQAKEQGGEVVISVADRGVGIAAEHLPRVFERFYRTDKARSRAMGGTGLGLSIVKHVALAHQGRVTVDSSPGEGSVFRIHLPRG